MSKGKELVKNTGILFIGKISTQFVSFLLLPLYTAKLSTEEYGTLDLYTTIAGILIPVLSLQLEQAVFRYLLTSEEDEKAVLSSTTFFLIMSSIILTVIYIPVGRVLGIQFLGLVLLYYISTLFSTVIQQVPRGYGNYTDYTVAAFISSVVSIVFSVFFICIFNQGIDGILRARVISSVVTVGFVSWRTKIVSKIRLRFFRWSSLKSMLKYSVPLVFNQLASWIVNYSDRVIIIAVLGVASNGIYAIANKFFSLITTTLNIYNLAWTESVTKTLDDPKRNTYYNTVFELTTALFMIAAAGVTAGVGVLFKYFINESYSAAYVQIPILVYAAMFSGLSANVGSIYIAYKRTKEISKTTIATAVINLVVHIGLIKIIGLYAASISTLVSFAAMFFYRVYKIYDTEPLHISGKVILQIIPVTVFTIATYYSRLMVLQIVSLILLAVYAMIYLFSQKVFREQFDAIINKYRGKESVYMEDNRDVLVDLIKGLLIVFVVVGHFQRDTIHDIIFLFHMPLFFVLSGVFLQKEKLISKSYLKRKTVTLLVPYGIYLLLDLFFMREDYSFGSIVRAIWGGRAVSGVYWYVTCFLFALFVFAALLKHFSEKTVKCLILAGGGMAVIESHLMDKIHLLQSPGVPWNLDVALMALVYIGIGFFYKDKIKKLLKEDTVKLDIGAGLIALLLSIFCWANYRGDSCFYYFDMKPAYYKELISAILIPCAFGVVLARVVHRIGKIKVLKRIIDFFALCGRATIPIMFLHIPLNYWKDSLGYGRGGFIFIGVGIPLLFTIVFGKFSVMRKLFGLTELTRR